MMPVDFAKMQARYRAGPATAMMPEYLHIGGGKTGDASDYHFAKRTEALRAVEKAKSHIRRKKHAIVIILVIDGSFVVGLLSFAPAKPI